MKKYRQTEGINTSEYVIRRPLFWVVFLSIMLTMSLVALILDTPYTETRQLQDIIFEIFYSLFGFSFWIPASIISFVLLAVNLYIYFRFKLVIHEHSFSVTPLLGDTHDVTFSSVEKVTNKRFSKKGAYIEIEYDNKKIRIPYTVNSKGVFRQKSFDVLLKKLEGYTTTINTGELKDLFE
jgi:hypothetical protein